MLLDGLGWSHYSVFAPCIMTQTRVLGRSGGGMEERLWAEDFFFFFQKRFFGNLPALYTLLELIFCV